MTKKQKIIFWVVAGLIFLTGVGLWFYQDYAKFERVSKQFDEIQTIVAKEGATSFNKIKQCSYNSQKYSKGERSCEVSIVFSTNNKNINFSPDTSWRYKFDNSKGLSEDTGRSFLSNRVYENGEMTCADSVVIVDKGYEHTFDCIGPAMFDYYPVKE